MWQFPRQGQGMQQTQQQQQTAALVRQLQQQLSSKYTIHCTEFKDVLLSLSCFLLYTDMLLVGINFYLQILSNVCSLMVCLIILLLSQAHNLDRTPTLITECVIETCVAMRVGYSPSEMDCGEFKTDIVWDLKPRRLVE